MNQKTWSVTIVIDDYKSAETGAQTRARARLRTSGPATFVGTGLARRNPHHTDVPEVSDDMAAARALADLSHQLYEAAAQREAVTRSALTSARAADVPRPEPAAHEMPVDPMARAGARHLYSPGHSSTRTSR